MFSGGMWAMRFISSIKIEYATLNAQGQIQDFGKGGGVRVTVNY